MNAELFIAKTEYYMKLRHMHGGWEQLRQHLTSDHSYKPPSNKTLINYKRNPNLMPIGIFKQIMTTLNVPKEEQIELFNSKEEK